METNRYLYMKLELHYSLIGNDNHSMDAVIHNECEKYFIHALLSLNKYFDNPIVVKICAEEKGGLTNIIDIAAPTIMLGLVTNWIYDFLKYFIIPKTDNPTEVLNKIEVVQKIKTIMNSSDPLTAAELDYITTNNIELRKLKSEYFKTAKKDNSIEYIELTGIGALNNHESFHIGKIKYNDFDKCILTKDEESDSNDIDAIIYIVAPVLIKGRKDYWKGIFENNSIDFRVSDKEFLSQVYSNQITFKNGTRIICKMNITQTLSTIDRTIKISRNVSEVYNVKDNEDYQYEVRRKPRKGKITSPELPFEEYLL